MNPVRDIRRFASGLGAVAWRELLALFVTPLAYVVGTLFLLLQGWNFALLLRVLNDPLAAPGPVMQYYFGGSFFIFWLPVVFLSAAISMRTLAEERRQGTLEALLTAPLMPSQVVLGKFVGALGFYAALWLPTGVFYVLLRGAQIEPDPGPIASGYLGTVLVGATFLAIGVLASALTRSQLAAAISTFVACSILLLAGLLVDQVQSEALSSFLQRTSLLSMMQELAQGIVDTRWLFVHAAIVLVALGAAVVAVDPRRNPQRWLQLALGAVVVVNLASFGVLHAKRYDWTGGRVYSLSDRARTVLQSFEQGIDVWVVVPSTIGAGRSNPLEQELREVLTRMSRASAQLRVRFVDPDRDRQEAEQLVKEFGLGGRDLADGVVLVRSGQGSRLRKTHVLPTELVTYATGADVQATGPRVKEFRGEEALLTAFVKVTDPIEATVCHTQGHGEPQMDNLEPFGGYAHLESLLEDAGLTVRVADLDSADGLQGCDVLLVAGPAGPFPSAHVEAVRRYADAGGDLLLLTGAVVTPAGEGLATHGLEPLVRRYGIVFGQRLVVDPHPMAGSTPLLSFTLVDGWGQHPIVRPLLGRPVSLVFVRELALVPSETGATADVLVSVSEEGWAEADLQGIRSGELPQPGEADQAGPLPVAVASELGGSRLVVIASDQFALNAYLREDVAYDYGRDLVLNAVGWLTDKEVLLGIRPRPREHVKLVLLPRQLQRMTLVCIVGLPAFTILLGIWVVWRRRR